MFFSFTRELDVEAGYVVSALFSLSFSPSLFSELKKRFFCRTAVPCANSSGHVKLTPPDDAACNMAISGALCGVIEAVWVAET